PIAAPAANFTLQFGDSAFPGTPVLFLSADRRLVDFDSLPRNATTVNQVSKTTEWIEDILQMAPDTTSIAVVLGASPTELIWKEIISRECQAFKDRVTLTFFNGMSLDEMERQASAMPPHSFILFAMLMRDGAGITYDGYTALERLRAAANAPIYGVHESLTGRGIVGGRLLLDQTMGILAAHSAARILSGEPATSIPDKIVPTPAPVYDWRELTRWGISEARLPAGSAILFREPTFWERYRWRIVGIVSFSLIQTLLIFGLLVNLRKRRRAEQSLQQRNRYIETILEESPIGFAAYAVDDGAGRFVSARFEEICRVPRGTIDSHDTFFDKVWPYNPDVREQIRRRVIRDMTSSDVSRTHYDLPFQTATGETRYINVTSIQVPGQDLMVSTVQDVTDHVRAQEALRESDERLRLAARAAEFGAFSFDRAGRQVFCSPEVLVLWGLPPDGSIIVGEDDLPEALHPDDKGRFRTQLLAAADPGGAGLFDLEYRIIRADGEIRWLRSTGKVTFSAEGQPIRADGITQDITKRKNAEEALRLSEERFRQVAETVSDFVWEVDAQGLYTYTSPSVEKILGYTPDEMVGKMHFYDLFVPDVREQLKTAAFEAFEAQQRFHAFPNGNLRKCGEVVYLETSGVPIVDEAGRLLGYRGADTDITDRCRAEMEVQLLRQELTFFSRVATLAELTASIAHELNQPLAAILANAQAALRLMQREPTDMTELREILIDIADDDERAAEVIRSMRSMLKGGDSKRQMLSLSALIRDVMPLVRNEALIKDVSIVLDFGSPMPPVKGNRIQLQQVIVNLIVNALEAMEASEHPRELVLRIREADGEILVDVEDSGSGIPEDKLDSIFQPFFTTKTSGLGMGLPLSRSIVYSHNGRLWAENNPDGGATFHLALPVSQVASGEWQVARGEWHG
ncbi:MAG: PAS domain S-box protein, partial [Acidobacteria bacterium]